MTKSTANATVRFGEIVLEITDPHAVKPENVDLMVEARHLNGIVALGFASIIMDGDGEIPARIAMVTSRLRMNLTAALDLRNVLEKILEGSVPAKEKAN